MIYQIDFIDSVYIKDFYDKIIPQIRDYFHAHRGKKLIFNFVDLHFLSPNVVPNILNIADIYKQFFNGKTISLKLSWNPELLSYLYTIDFFKYTNKLQLFDYDTEILGGFKTFASDKNCRLIFSEKNSSEDDIVRKIKYLMHSMITFKILDKDVRNINDINDMLSEILFHLIHNSNDIERGNSNAYGLFQINRYKNNNTAYLSICDRGEGIPATIWQKFVKKEAEPLFVRHKDDPTYYFILEALFWRKRINTLPYKHGIYNVAEYVLKKGGKLGIHSDDTYVLFTRDFLETFIEISQIIDELKEKDKLEENGASLEYSTNILIQKTLIPELLALLDYYAERNARTRKYQGVHIDIEIPLGEKR